MHCRQMHWGSLGGVFPEGVNEFMLQVNIINILADRVLMQEILDDTVLEVRPIH